MFHKTTTHIYLLYCGLQHTIPELQQFFLKNNQHVQLVNVVEQTCMMIDSSDQNMNKSLR